MKCEFYHYYFAEDVDECNDVLLSPAKLRRTLELPMKHLWTD